MMQPGLTYLLAISLVAHAALKRRCSPVSSTPHVISLVAQAFPETIGEKPPPVVEAQVQRAIEGCVAGCAERLETLACLAWQGWLRCAPSTRLS